MKTALEMMGILAVEFAVLGAVMWAVARRRGQS